MAFPVLMVTAGINGTADYMKNCGRTEWRMANIIAGGSYVTGLAKYNDRLFLKALIGQMDSLPQEVVLGSSRVMQITHEFAKYGRFYNSAVFGAQLEDIVGVYGLYEMNGAPLERVIIGIDPWIFRGDSGREYETLNEQFRAICVKIGIPVPLELPLWSRFDKLVSVSKVRESLGYISTMVWSDAGQFVPTKDSLNIGATEYSDGSYSVSEAERNVSREELTHFDMNAHLNKGFTRLSDYQQELFRKFVLYLKGRNMEVVLLFVPYHPLVWERVRVSDRMVLETERVVRKFAADNNIQVLGTYDPAVYKLDVMSFLNGGHPKKEVFDYVFGEKRN